MDISPAVSVDYRELTALADSILGECDDDVEKLACRLDSLPAGICKELLVSDMLNAFQVFYYFFRQMPDDIEAERMMLQPASELSLGVLIGEIELLELIFAMQKDKPVIFISDGDQVLAAFTGKNAYTDALAYVMSTL